MPPSDWQTGTTTKTQTERLRSISSSTSQECGKGKSNSTICVLAGFTHALENGQVARSELGEIRLLRSE
jgi:hypothetical protein